MTEAVEAFAAVVRRVLGEQGETTQAIWTLGPELQRLAALPELERLIRERSERREPLYRDPGGAFVLGQARFAAGHVTPVHSHAGWGLLCLRSGDDQYTSWRREDGALRLVQEHHLQPGDLAYWFNRPYNIHRQAAGPQGTTELVLHKGDGRRVEHFDLSTGVGSPAPLRQAGRGVPPSRGARETEPR